MPFEWLLSFHRRSAFVPVAAAYLFLVRPMQRWLRWFLIIFTVGGDFLGFVLGLPSLLYAARTESHRLVEAVVFAPVYGYAIYLGLRLVEGHKPIGGLILYFALQIPWIDCAGFSYRFYSGLLISLLYSPKASAGLLRLVSLTSLYFHPACRSA